MSNHERPPIQPGEPAPDFSLPSCSGQGTVSLSDFRGRSPVLLALDRGVFCPFCRRHLVQLGSTSEKLRELGVETLVVVVTPAERTRKYLQLRPTRVAVASDEQRTTHQAFGLPNPPVTPELAEVMRTVMVNPTGELPRPVPVAEINQAMNALDGYRLDAAEQAELHNHMNRAVILTGQVLIDREGIVRWRNIECEQDGLEGAARFPSDETILAAARTL